VNGTMPEPERQNWLRCYRPRPDAAVRLVCFPHAGGSAGFFRPWLRDLPADVEMHAVQYPGRADRLDEPPQAELTALADRVTDALAGLADRPLALFGHSLGAAVAFEVARRVRSRPGVRVDRLIVSGRPGPRHAGVQHLGTDEDLWSELRRLGGTDEGLLGLDELRALLMPALRADYRMSETYHPAPQPLLDCPVLACTGDADPEVRADELTAWSKFTTAEFTLREFAGDHFYLVPRQRGLLGLLTRELGVGRAWPSMP
jgi:pyochelin biosynthetic protein PchC